MVLELMPFKGDQGRNECNHGVHFSCSLFPKSAQSTTVWCNNTCQAIKILDHSLRKQMSCMDLLGDITQLCKF